MNPMEPKYQMYNTLTARLDQLAPLADLLLRTWVARAFWLSGLTKIQTWDSTLYLFNEEYAVPLLSPELAAWLATIAELSLPVLLVLGLAARPAATLLFLFNLIAVISYPGLEAAGIEQHVVWGLLLLAIVLRGAGSWSLDRLLQTCFLTTNLKHSPNTGDDPL